jgi:hypothetical protein
MSRQAVRIFGLESQQNTYPPFAAVFHYAFVSHDAQMLGDVALGYSERIHQLRDRAFPVAKSLHDAQPPGIGECLADRGVEFVQTLLWIAGGHLISSLSV